MADLAIDVVKATSEFVAAQAWEEIKLALGFQGHLENLKKRFNDTQAFLNGVRSDNDNQSVDSWLQKVKNVAYFADNVMDDYDYEIIRKKIELGENLTRKKKVCNFFSCSNNPVVFRFRMTHKVLEILSKFDELDKEAKRIGLKQVKLLDKSVPTTSNAGRENLEIIRKNASAFEVIGREDDKQILLEMMCSPENDKEHLFTIAIVGLGGFGKTTLTRALYHNEEKVTKHFDNKMWVCVSEDFNVERILKEMVELLSLKKCDLTNMELIREELQKELEGKRFLLVLDDVWTADKALWDSLKNKLRTIKGRQGSVILVTTRSKKVATSAGVRKPYELNGLSDEDSWTLFEKQVNIPTPSHMEVGHRIVKKCNGVPLAITTMGGLLQSKERIQDWESIERNEVWDTSSENDPNYILPSLFLSYQHLPSLSLKQCFAYCATFPKDHIMEKNELIDLWIAQGFLKTDTSNSTLTMEKMGEDYFKTLLNISFLQLEEDNWGENNTGKEIWICKMHDLVHDLAIHILKKELFIWDAKVVDPYISLNHHHLVLYDFKEEKSKALKDEIIQQVRTMNVWSGKFPSWNVLAQARYLRTLILVDKGMTEEVLAIIGKLKHLRYLDLSSKPIETLSDSICKLYQLQVLILLDTRLKKLPKVLCKLVSLRRLTISGRECQHLPINDLGKLPSLRGLCLYGFPNVEYIGEELNSSENENNHFNKSLEKGFFPVLRELRIYRFQSLKNLNLLPPTNATTLATIDPFPCLEVLEIAECPKLEVAETSPALSFNSLRSLYLEEIGESEKPLDIIKYHKIGSVTSLATTVADPFTCLEVLEIAKCRKLKIVETSPALRFESLKFLCLETIGECQQPLDIIKYHKSGSLTSLVVKSMPEMKCLPQSLSNCSRLETFCLVDCPKLVCLPSGLSSLVSLKHLKLGNCTALDSLPDDMFHGSSLSSLCVLNIDSCSNLVSLPDEMFKGLSSLRILNITNCRRLEKIPTSVTECTSLEKLVIVGCESLKHPIPDLSKLHGLVSLNIHDATSSVLEWIPHLRHLQNLVADVEHEIESRDNTPSPGTRCLSYLMVFCNDNHHTITPPLHKHNDSLEELTLYERSKNKQQKMKGNSKFLFLINMISISKGYFCHFGYVSGANYVNCF